MSLTPEQERDFRTVNQMLPLSPMKGWEALSRLRSDLEAAKAGLDAVADQLAENARLHMAEVERLQALVDDPRQLLKSSGLVQENERLRAMHVEAFEEEAAKLRAEVARLKMAVADNGYTALAAQQEVERLRGTLKAADIVKERLREEVERLRAKVSAMQTMALSTGYYTADQETLVAEIERLRAWGQQVHDALDGKPLPELPDEAPARIERLRAENDALNKALFSESSADRALAEEEA